MKSKQWNLQAQSRHKLLLYCLTMTPIFLLLFVLMYTPEIFNHPTQHEYSKNNKKYKQRTFLT